MKEIFLKTGKKKGTTREISCPAPMHEAEWLPLVRSCQVLGQSTQCHQPVTSVSPPPKQQREHHTKCPLHLPCSQEKAETPSCVSKVRVGPGLDSCTGPAHGAPKWQKQALHLQWGSKVAEHSRTRAPSINQEKTENKSTQSGGGGGCESDSRRACVSQGESSRGA